MLGLILAIMTTAPSATPQDPAAGISKALAESRRRSIAVERYELRFDLFPGRDSVSGEAVVYFKVPEDAPPTSRIVADFAGQSVDDFRINGVGADDVVRRVHNHILIPTDDLDPGLNRFGMSFTSKVAASGTPLTTYRDRTRSEEYLYTLLVPADAHGLFPCFDQPDLKATFRLRLTVPEGWVAVANGAAKGEPEQLPDDRLLYEFEDSKPLSTYLFAFAAGPFRVVTHAGAKVPMRMFVRPAEFGNADTAAIFSLHERSVRWHEQYFGIDYPFGKLDVVLVPGFPYGGMEHAGAIFYRETSLAFDHAPTTSELLSRSSLIYHEVSHQWFGNLVTMRWFDDLWLKEGFANLVAYLQVEALEPELNAWLRFHQRLKTSAYAIDSTPGTTAVYQPLDNLADAKSNYSAIVYDKAPAVLRELQGRLGGAFQRGIAGFLSKHAWGNAEWTDLVAALHQASGERLDEWSARWILAPGMPRVRPVWTSSRDGKIARFEIRQSSTLGDGETWPMSFEALLIGGDASRRRVRVTTRVAETAVDALIGQPAPVAVLLNPGDQAYGAFELDDTSTEWWLQHVADERDAMVRATALTVLWGGVREAEIDPSRFADLALQILAKEDDALSQTWLLRRLGTCLSRYLGEEAAESRRGAAAELLLDRLNSGPETIRLQTFRFLCGACSSEERVRGLCAALLDGESGAPKLELGARDRYLALAALAAWRAAGERLEAMTKRSIPAGSERWAFVARAAIPDADEKESYFARYVDADGPPEQWVQQSLGYFHWSGQEKFTLPYLRKALDRVDWVKQNRRIFFMPAWIDAFVNGHSSAEALEIVDKFLAEGKLSDDVRKKLLQSLDGLRRAVRIRAKYGV